MDFIAFVGSSFLNGKAVVAYADGDKILLRAETAGGKRLKTSYVDDEGQTRVVTIADRCVTPQRYEELRDEWAAGVRNNDIRVVERALAWMEGDDE